MRTLLLLLPVLALSWAEEWYADARELYFGIPVSVRFAPADTVLADRVWAALVAIDDDFNDYRDSSAIGAINAGGPGTYVLNPSLTEAFDLADRMRSVTGGACEITVGPLRRLWRGAEKARRWPTSASIAAARAAVGPGVYARSGDRLTVLRAGVGFDFGGVCKGIAVDRAVAILRAAGRTAGLVQVGGETAAWGMGTAGRTHRIGIPHPDDPDDPDRLVARVQDPGTGLSGSTSGNYRNPITVEGRPLYHIFDPRSGLPADTGILSFSVVFPGTGRNGEADCLTKTGILLGEEGLRLVAAAGGEALLLRRRQDGGIDSASTPGWARFALPAPTSAGTAAP